MNEYYAMKNPTQPSIGEGQAVPAGKDTVAKAIAVKRGLAGQIREAMKEQNINKTQMARLMATSRSSLDRLLDMDDGSLTLATLAGAARVLGKKIDIRLI